MFCFSFFKISSGLSYRYFASTAITWNLIHFVRIIIIKKLLTNKEMYFFATFSVFFMLNPCYVPPTRSMSTTFAWEFFSVYACRYLRIFLFLPFLHYISSIFRTSFLSCGVRSLLPMKVVTARLALEVRCTRRAIVETFANANVWPQSQTPLIFWI